MKSLALIAIVVALASLLTACEVAPVRGGTVVGIKTPWAIGDREKRPAPNVAATQEHAPTASSPPSVLITATAPPKKKVVAKRPATQPPAPAEAAPPEPVAQPEKRNPWAIAPQP